MVPQLHQAVIFEGDVGRREGRLDWREGGIAMHRARAAFPTKGKKNLFGKWASQ